MSLRVGLKENIEIGNYEESQRAKTKREQYYDKERFVIKQRLVEKKCIY